MKKYNKPTVKWMEIESEGMIADSIVISKDPATDPACAKGHYGSSDWDEDDYSGETTYSNPNVYGEY